MNKLSRITYLDVLLSLYDDQWPGNAAVLYKALVAVESLDPRILHAFKKRINSLDHPHPDRYERNDFFAGIYFISETDHFKKLNQKINRLIAKSTIKRETEAQSVYQNLIHFLQNAIDYFFANPLEPVLVILEFFLIVLLLSKITRENKLNQEINHSPINAVPHHLRTRSTHYLKEYQDLSIVELSLLNSCAHKTKGASEGKICSINGITFFMKKVINAEENGGNDPLLGEYNRRFIERNIGSKKNVPTVRFFYDHGNHAYYYASEKVEHFHTAIKLCKPYNPIDVWCDYKRGNVVSKIGEIGIAQLAVINTFIKDMHAENWGFIEKTPDRKNPPSFSKARKSQLVIIDADQSPKTLEDYLNHAQDKFSLAGENGGFGLALSLNTVIKMKQIYQSMVSKPAPRFHPSLDIPQALYSTLLSIYMSACDDTIEILSSKTHAHQADTPHFEINQQFASSIQWVAPDIDHAPTPSYWY